MNTPNKDDGRPEMGAKRITLINAWAMAKKHPDSFEVPTPSELAKLRPGDLVKVASFIDHRDGGLAAYMGNPPHLPTSERFWVQIVARNSDIFIGRVDNELWFTHGVDLNDHIEFHACNVYEAMYASATS
jgi:hypothetical protein